MLFFCHQVVEKSLKSHLLFKEIKSLPHIHILPSLLALCEEKDKDFSQFRESCQILNEYYIETKYPVKPPFDYPKDEAEEAIEKAEKIFAFVKKKLTP